MKKLVHSYYYMLEIECAPLCWHGLSGSEAPLVEPIEAKTVGCYAATGKWRNAAVPKATSSIGSFFSDRKLNFEASTNTTKHSPFADLPSFPNCHCLSVLTITMALLKLSTLALLALRVASVFAAEVDVCLPCYSLL